MDPKASRRSVTSDAIHVNVKNASAKKGENLIAKKKAITDRIAVTNAATTRIIDIAFHTDSLSCLTCSTTFFRGIFAYSFFIFMHCLHSSCVRKISPATEEIPLRVEGSA